MTSVPHADVTLATAVAFLSLPQSYSHRPADVELVETHFACVFLAGRFVYKLKKPIRFHGIDFTTLELRRANCETELALNRRLADAVYIDVVPLRMEKSGLALESAGEGRIVEWLVKMHRLPRERMLDARAKGGAIAHAELRTLMAKLAAFYSHTARAPWDGPEYLRRLAHQIETHWAQLRAYRPSVDGALVERVVAKQRAFLRDSAGTLEARCALGHVVDAHGDLRPEHIFLDDHPQIIDCLEFSAELRLLDTAEEIAFLALECTLLGRPELAREIVSIYCELCHDALPQPLFDFYYRRRALVRALLCAWHLDEPLSEALRAHWRDRANRYLETALAALDGSGIL
jgi:aminoglycoside phosphotransferase family enzyme